MPILSLYFISTKIIKNGINLVGYTFRWKNYVKISPPPTFPIFQSWRRHCVIPACLVPFLVILLPFALTCSFNIATYFEISVGMDGPFLLIVAAMLTLSCEVQPCTHANYTLCSLRYWLAPLVTGPFLACSACYWPVPGLFRLLLACSLLVPLVTGLFRLFCVLVTSIELGPKNSFLPGSKPSTFILFIHFLLLS